MSKIAIVGCQQSGKTVFMASLSDYFRAGQREGQTSWLIPENSDAHKFTEMRNYEMRVQGIWPEATLTNPTSLKWSLRQKDGAKTDIEMLEFSGEVFRAAFREEGTSPQHKEAAENLVSYLIDAEFVVVLVGLNELFRSKEDQTVFEDDIESTWVTRGLIDFVKNNLPPRVGLIIALTQADLYKAELEKFGGAAGVLKSRWPMIYALYPDIPVVAVASVSKTTADGRPAEGYTTEGVLPVMKAYSEFLYGDPSGLISELDDIAGFLKDVSQACPLETIEQKLARHKQLFEDLNKRVTIVDALYDEIIKTHRSLNAEGESIVGALRTILARPVEERLGSSIWDGLRAQFPGFAKTVDAFEADTLAQNKVLQEEKARKEEEDRKAREEEARRLEESARQDEERRRQIELKEKEQQAAAEALRIQKEKSRVASRAFAVRAIIAFLIVLSIGVGIKKWRDSVEQQRLVQIEKARLMEQERKARIESENAVKLAEVRKAEAAQRALEEKNRAEELARKRLEEENRQKELELKKQEEARIAADEEQRKIAAEIEKKRAESERRRAEQQLEQQKLELEVRKLEAERALEDAKARQAEANLNQAKLEAAKEKDRQDAVKANEERRLEAESWFAMLKEDFKSAEANVSITDMQRIVNEIDKSVARLSEQNRMEFARMCYVLGTWYCKSRTILRSPEKGQWYIDYAESLRHGRVY